MANKLLHWIIVINFIVGIAYSCYQIFWVLQPVGHYGPLGLNALYVQPEIFWARRAYAIEAWIAISGFSVYLAVKHKV